MNSICGCAPGNDITIWYSILLHTRIVSSRKKKARPNTVSLGILNIMLPIIVPIHTCLFLINRYRLMRKEMRTKKEKKRRIPLGIKFYHLYPVYQKMERYIDGFFLLDLDPSGLTGLEPAASALTGRCSDQLNYNPGERKCTAYIFL